MKEEILEYIRTIRRLRMELPEQVKESKSQLEVKITLVNGNIFPIFYPKNYKAIMKALDYLSPISLMFQKIEFLQRWKSWNEDSMRRELASIKTFIDIAEGSRSFYKENYTAIPFLFPTLLPFAPARPFDEGIYLQLTDPKALFRIHRNSGFWLDDMTNECRVYARYFVFRTYLETRLSDWAKVSTKKIKGRIDELKKEGKALVYYYQMKAGIRKPVSEPNKSEVEEYFNTTIATLRTAYSKIHNSTDRLGLEGTLIKDRNKLQLFELVLKFLKETSRAGKYAAKDLLEFKQKFEKHYGKS